MRCSRIARTLLAPMIAAALPATAALEEQEYRVELCESCRTYLKQVDSRAAGRPLYPPLEHVVTLHLDLAIQKKGYRPSSIVPL